MKIYVVVAWLCTGVTFTAKAEPLVTISCEKPEGSSITYGVPLKERLDALAQEQPTGKSDIKRSHKKLIPGQNRLRHRLKSKKNCYRLERNVAVPPDCRWRYCSVPARTDFGHSS